MRRRDILNGALKLYKHPVEAFVYRSAVSGKPYDRPEPIRHLLHLTLKRLRKSPQIGHALITPSVGGGMVFKRLKPSQSSKQPRT